MQLPAAQQLLTIPSNTPGGQAQQMLTIPITNAAGQQQILTIPVSLAQGQGGIQFIIPSTGTLNVQPTARASIPTFGCYKEAFNFAQG